jgi:hypothetical protein
MKKTGEIPKSSLKIFDPGTLARWDEAFQEALIAQLTYVRKL